MDDIFDGYKEIVKKEGHRVEMSTPYCKEFKFTHDKCIGCESEKGCKIYVGILAIVTESLMYKPISYDDMVETNRKVQERIQKVLKGEEVWGR